jgi:predicted nucleic acid-binding protein
MGIILDTNVFIDVENKRLQPERLDKLIVKDSAFICAITVSELLTGVHIASTPGQKIQRSAFVEGVISNLSVLPFGEDIARTYAELHTYFIKMRGKSGATVHDLQIAATAITHGYTLLTSNIKDFKKIPVLDVKSL